MERVVEHQLDVIQGMLQTRYDDMPAWKKAELVRWIEHGFEIIDRSNDRRREQRRHNGR